MSDAKGMLGLFSDVELPDGALDELLDGLVEQGVLEADGPPGPTRRYRMTEAGVRYVEQELFPSLGVTPDEAAAWMREQLEP